MMQPGATGLIAMTQKYVILMVSHSRVDKATGTNAFEDISALEPKDQSGKPLTRIARNELPPPAAAFLAGLEAYGKGIKMFVFDRGEVDSCRKGELSVSLAGENYTWETPFPGCSSAIGRERSADRTWLRPRLSRFLR
jgi:hypothetical protein